MNVSDLTRKLSLLMIDTKLSDIEDCETKHYLKYDVTNEDTLKKVLGRYHITDSGLKIIDKDYYHLIGKTIKLRSPITCNEDEGACDICYGKMAKINRNLHIGIIAVLFLTEQITQRLLSAKHLLQAVSDELDWSNTFTKYFVVDRNMVFINRDNITKDVSIIIKEEDLYMDDEHSSYAIDKMYIENDDGDEKLIELPITFFPSELLLERINSVNVDGIIKINTIKYSDMDVLFKFIMENNELSKPLKKILKLIENKDHLGLSNFNDIHNKFIELIQESGINLDSVHAELIVSKLIRDTDNLLNKPNFLGEKIPPYKVLRVSSAIQNSKSPSVSLAFERLKGQFLSPLLYQKDGTSIIDNVFI